MSHPAARALKGHAFVASSSVKQPFRIVDDQVYAKLGGNETLQPSPAIVHFGGFALNETVTQVLKVVNTSNIAQRLHVINTTTPHFSVSCNKKGVVAPGMAENIVIKFKPDEWRYYYDCVRIHCQDENLLIPIHAYPVANDVFCPTFLDFGSAALLDKVTKTISLSCKVPIQFEYELTIVKPHSDFEVYPLKGIIPANGKTDITVTYCPVKLGTAEMTFQVSVSQFNFEPFQCRIVGNAAPGITRQRVLNKFASKHGPASELSPTHGGSANLGISMNSEVSRDEDHDRDALNATSQTFSLARKNVNNVPLETYDTKADLSWHGLGSGAAIDAGGAYIGIKTRKRHRRKMEISKQNSLTMTSEELKAKAKEDSKHDIPEETVVDGIRIPRDLSTMSSVNFVLTQEVGKLKPKDLKKAVTQQRAMREKRRLEQEALKKQNSGGMVPDAESIITSVVNSVGGKQSTRQLKEMVFLQEFRDLTKGEEDLEFQTQRERIGNVLIKKQDTERILLARAAAQESKLRVHREKDRRRYFTQVQGPLRDGDMLGRAECMSYLLGRPERVPQFDIYSNNVWLMRKEVLQRFVGAVNTTMIRRRVKKRYNMLMHKLRHAGVVTRADARAFVERDNRLANISEGGQDDGDDENTAGDAEAFALASRIDLVAFDEYSASGGGEKTSSGGSIFDPVNADCIRDFDHLETLPLRHPNQAGLLNYDAMPNPAVSIYMPKEANRQLRTGAEEEEPIRVSAKVPSAPKPAGEGESEDADTKEEEQGKEMAVVPLPKGFEAWLEANPMPLKTLLKPDPTVRVFLDTSEPRESDPEYVLKPAYVKFDPPATRRRAIVERAGCSSIGSIEGVAMVSSVYRPVSQHRFSTLSSHDDHRTLWDVKERPILGTNEEDLMSDTDSDEEPVEDEEPLMPTVELCKSFFDSDETEEGSAEMDGGDATEGDAEKAADEEAAPALNAGADEEEPKPKDLFYPLSREAKWVQLLEERKLERDGRCKKFREELNKVDGSVSYPRHKLYHTENSV
jgi:hypothetical protein